MSVSLQTSKPAETPTSATPAPQSLDSANKGAIKLFKRAFLPEWERDREFRYSPVGKAKSQMDLAEQQWKTVVCKFQDLDAQNKSGILPYPHNDIFGEIEPAKEKYVAAKANYEKELAAEKPIRATPLGQVVTKLETAQQVLHQLQNNKKTGLEWCASKWDIETAARKDLESAKAEGERLLAELEKS